MGVFFLDGVTADECPFRIRSSVDSSACGRLNGQSCIYDAGMGGFNVEMYDI